MVRFGLKPDRATLEVMRLIGKYRKGPRLGMPPCWYCACTRADLRRAAEEGNSRLLIEALDGVDVAPAEAAEAEAEEHCPACGWEQQLGDSAGAQCAEPHTLCGDCWYS